ncbi:helix-turn-helix transcriptional regulator [Brevibacillus parabrevis]|uniref:DeoR family transcriptional regulator n=1 Tax=Brevibacillus parabrevis TaxID=54914 RepID=A0A4Y3PM03_BREPA|nr:YafY family protein [Brevibacillus parabrevis]RNB96063.1 YafY family transcriptional regulator [Brevibacillus parabrevis]GEB32338.1 DeoR family transcriptional regulator [Brevibacillus parabrevis]
MAKTQRLLELLMTVNRKRKFTVGELAQEFGVSQRTILRDLQELSEWGVPLYSEVGPHGGYRVLKERILPPIAFSEEEAVAIFFAIQSLRHYSALPFAAEAASATSKFYAYMPPDVRERIDEMRHRVDFVTPKRQADSPHLSILLDAAVNQKVLAIAYESREKQTNRRIQPIGIYTQNGLWYCPAYCFYTSSYRVFRCDRIQTAVECAETEPLDLRDIHLDNRESRLAGEEKNSIAIRAELTRVGVQKCEAERWSAPMLTIRPDGTGSLSGQIAESDRDFFATFFIGLGREATVTHSPELLASMRSYLAELSGKYP